MTINVAALRKEPQINWQVPYQWMSKMTNEDILLWEKEAFEEAFDILNSLLGKLLTRFVRILVLDLDLLLVSDFFIDLDLIFVLFILIGDFRGFIQVSPSLNESVFYYLIICVICYIYGIVI